MTDLKAIVKWPGGKISESEKILPLLPHFNGRFIDPFVGGGAIYFASQARKAAINDLSDELISLYRFIQMGNKNFFSSILHLDHIRQSLSSALDNDIANLLTLFDDFISEDISKAELKYEVESLVGNKKNHYSNYTLKQIEANVFLQETSKNLTRKLIRMQSLSIENGKLNHEDIIKNLQTAMHSAFYMYVRHLYNFADEINLSDTENIATFYYMREFCYSSMFRFNKDRKFNVPYGGMAYNSKDFSSKISRIQQLKYKEYLERTEIYNEDFSVFFEKIVPSKEDFIFLDPPYDSDFSTYDGNSFDKKDHERLAAFMRNTSAKFMMVIKDTDFIRELFGTIPGVQKQIFDKKYMVSFQNRNDKRAKHLIITNYPLQKQNMF